MTRVHSLALAWAVLFLPASVQARPVGMAWLKIGAGADAIAKADAVVSHVEGPIAAYWNAAGLGFQDGLQATAVHNESLQSVRHEFLGLARRAGPVGIALTFQGVWTDNLKAYDESANYLGEFGYYGMALTASAGWRWTDRWGTGATVKYLREAIDVYDAAGVAFDLGLQGRGVLPRIDVGASLLNLGSSMQYEEEPFDLPLALQAGATYRHPFASIQSEALLAAEVRAVRGEDANLLLGLEYRIQQTARMRLGYRSGLETEDVSFGIGFLRGPLQADYAYIPFGEDLGAQHRIGLTYRR